MGRTPTAPRGGVTLVRVVFIIVIIIVLPLVLILPLLQQARRRRGAKRRGETAQANKVRRVQRRKNGWVEAVSSLRAAEGRQQKKKEKGDTNPHLLLILLHVGVESTHKQRAGSHGQGDVLVRHCKEDKSHTQTQRAERDKGALLAQAMHAYKGQQRRPGGPSEKEGCVGASVCVWVQGKLKQASVCVWVEASVCVCLG